MAITQTLAGGALHGFVLCALLSQHPAVAQSGSQLERFEKDATRQSPDKKSGESSDRSATRDESQTSEDGGLFSGLIDAAFELIADGGARSWRRVASDPGVGGVPPREPGESVIVYARLDVSLLQVSSRIFGNDVRAELGYGPVGFAARTTRFREDNPSAELDASQYHLLYRMSAGDRGEIALGYGRFRLEGLSSTAGSSGTVSVLFYPTRHVGFEYRPSFSTLNGNRITDHEFSVNFGDLFWAARIGYRRLEGPSERLDGPFFGVSVRY